MKYTIETATDIWTVYSERRAKQLMAALNCDYVITKTKR